MRLISFFLSLYPSLSLSLSLTHTHTHTHKHTNTRTFSLSLSLSRAPLNPHSLPPSLSLSQQQSIYDLAEQYSVSWLSVWSLNLAMMRPDSGLLPGHYLNYMSAKKKKWFRGGEYMRPDSGLLPGHEMYYIHAKLCLVFQNEEFLGENLCTVDATCSAFFFVFFLVHNSWRHMQSIQTKLTPRYTRQIFTKKKSKKNQKRNY